MSEHPEHAKLVDAWIGRLSEDLPPQRQVAAFERGFTAVCRRAQRTLGEVTVSAIVDRVLHDASARFPLLAILKAEADAGVRFGELRQSVKPEDIRQLREGMRAALILFLTVLGNLTADILTPALHRELHGTDVESLTPADDRPPRRAARPRRESGGMDP